MIPIAIPMFTKICNAEHRRDPRREIGPERSFEIIAIRNALQNTSP